MGEIEGSYFTYTHEPEYETCPECGGSGKDNYTLDWKCYKCNGLGRIRIEPDKNKEDNFRV